MGSVCRGSSFVLFCALALVGCGGGGGGGYGGVSGGGFTSTSYMLQAADINNISAALTSGVNAANAAGSTHDFLRVVKDTTNIPINGQVACSGGGRQSYSGNVAVTSSQNDASIQGLVHIQYSDPTNNFNDCNVGNGLVLDGSLTLTMAGSASAGVGLSLVGSLAVRQVAPGGGLTAGQSCSIFLSVPKGGNRLAGSICGTSV